MANGEVNYSGPKMPDAALVTPDEIASGKVAAPEGTTPYTVQQGDNLTKIALQHGYADLPSFYKDNPQYAGRDPNLIYPGESVFVKPPQNGTSATGTNDPKSNEPLYQNYAGGKEVGKPFPADAAPNGLPANASVVDGNGSKVRTDGNGNLANGWQQVASRSDGDEYAYFINGQETTDAHRNGRTAPTGEPDKVKKDYAGQDITRDGWYVTAGSSQGVLMGYYVDGHRIEGASRSDARIDDPPPVIDPAT